MNHYVDYSAEELAQDDFFIEWVKYNNIRTETIWQNWLETYPFKRNEVEIARQIILYTLNLPTPEVTDSEINELKASIFDTLETRVSDEQQQVRKWIGFVAAASIVAVLCLWNWNVALNSSKSSLPQAQMSIAEKTVDVYNDSPTPKLIELPDGSSVLLKKGSHISYQNPFDLPKREVYLCGEAFFEIVKNQNCPFYVHTPHLITKVLGTSFNVCAFDSEKETSVTVKTGKVSVYKNAGNQAGHKVLEDNGLILIPNQKAILSRNNIMLYTENIEQSTVHYRNEIEDMTFNYEETSLQDICQQLEQAYHVQIDYDKTKIGDCPITANLTGVSFHEKLNLICKALQATYQLTDQRVVITGRGCG
jgi:transmembrane sensor